MQSPQNYQQSPQITFNQQVNNMSAVLNDAVLDDLLTSPVTDPMLCNNMYAENMMDALSGIWSIFGLKGPYTRTNNFNDVLKFFKYFEIN